MKILVIVVTYNGKPWLERCLGSVRASEVPADLYVWDNDSTDGTPDLVQSRFPEARLVRSADNLFFAEANNMGFRYALDKGYDYVYLLNQDAWLAPDTLGSLIAASEAHSEYAVLSPLQMTDGFQELDAQFKKVMKKPVSRVMAAHWMIPRQALEKVGLFDKLFPLYGNDDNWCDRARYHGFKIGIVPEAKAVHDRSTREERKEKVIYRNYFMGSLVRLCDINRPLWERFLYVCLFTLVKAVRYGSILPFKHFGSLCRMLPEVRRSRGAAR